MVTNTAVVRDSRHTKAAPESEPEFAAKSHRCGAPERNPRTGRHRYGSGVNVDDADLGRTAIGPGRVPAQSVDKPCRTPREVVKPRVDHRNRDQGEQERQRLTADDDARHRLGKPGP